MSEARALVDLGERYAALGLPVAARAAFERAASAEAGDPLPPRRLAELALALGEPDVARGKAGLAARLAPGPGASVLVGQAHLAAGELGAARLAFAQALEAAPPAVLLRAHLGRAQVALAEGDLAGTRVHALAAADAALADQPAELGELAVFDELAQLLGAAGAVAAAERRLTERADAALAPVLAAALATSRSTLAEAGRGERAADEALVRAGARWPRSRALRLRMLERRLGRRQREPALRAAAVAELEALVAEQEGEPGSAAGTALLARLWLALAVALEDEPDGSARAAAALRRGLELRPGHAAAAEQLAALALGGGDLDGALEAVEAGLRIDPRDGPGWRSAARVLEAAGPGAAAVAARLLAAAAPAAAPAAVVARLVRAATEVARGDVLGGVYTRGHRFKNLLGVAAARARTARRRAGGDLGERLDEIERELVALHEEWAVYLRSMESAGPRLEVLALAPIVAEVVAAAVARGQAAIDVRLPATLPELRGDRLLLREALANVVINAVEAGGGGGRVELAVHKVVAGGSILLEITVTDDGPGIAPADLPRLFSPGFTTKPLGSGIGLAVAARAIEAHHGRILVDSELGRGTRVTLLLPTAVAALHELPLGGG